MKVGAHYKLLIVQAGGGRQRQTEGDDIALSDEEEDSPELEALIDSYEYVMRGQTYRH